MGDACRWNENDVSMGDLEYHHCLMQDDMAAHFAIEPAQDEYDAPAPCQIKKIAMVETYGPWSKVDRDASERQVRAKAFQTGPGALENCPQCFLIVLEQKRCPSLEHP